MLGFKIFALFAVIAVASSDIQIREKYRTAKPISAHSRYQGLQLRENLSNNIELNSLIVGGQPAELGQFPHHALIFIVYSNGDTYLCGGSIIHRNWILTAGHCVFGGAQYFEIYLGVINISGPVSWNATVYPRDVFLHREYNDLTLMNDIAMIKLVDAPENLFLDPFVSPIALPSKITNLVQRTGTIIGFGRESDRSTSISNVLKFNTLRAITNQVCASYYVPGLVHETNLCAATNAQASTCGGDSGGSYIFNIDGVNILEGVTSFGASGGCQLEVPVGFTRVTSYLNWIYNNINEGTTTTTTEHDNRDDIKKILQDSLKIGRNYHG